MKASHRRVIRVLRSAGRVWQHTSEKRGYLITYAPNHVCKRVSDSTLRDMVEASLIVEDTANSVYRAGGGSDIHYRLAQP